MSEYNLKVCAKQWNKKVRKEDNIFYLKRWDSTGNMKLMIANDDASNLKKDLMLIESPSLSFLMLKEHTNMCNQVQNTW